MSSWRTLELNLIISDFLLCVLLFIFNHELLFLLAGHQISVKNSPEPGGFGGFVWEQFVEWPEECDGHEWCCSLQSLWGGGALWWLSAWVLWLLNQCFSLLYALFFMSASYQNWKGVGRLQQHGFSWCNNFFPVLWYKSMNYCLFSNLQCLRHWKGYTEFLKTP